jgi:hypothetical protein
MKKHRNKKTKKQKQKQPSGVQCEENVSTGKFFG